jgi:uncharacterized FAD-dependent dehydrogenase
MTSIINHLKDKVHIISNEKVYDIHKEYAESMTVDLKNSSLTCGKLIIAVGRSGAQWFGEICKKNGIKLHNNQVDIGVRVELPRMIWEDISQQIYEPKIVYRTKQYGDTTRMFCFNSGGDVVVENTDGILTVNGHANSDPNKKTVNSNFAILSTINFTQPFNEPIEYAKHIAKLGNMISGGNVLVQRFGDLLLGRRSDDKRISQSTVKPTLNAVAGDLSLCLPKRQLDNIIEMIYALDKIAQGTANYDTLLYGIEAKYYSSRPEFISDDFRIMDNVYVIGDCSSITRSLAQSGAMALYVADRMCNL